MSVIMYDCGFGDCFCLQEEHVDRPLFIDFGIHSASKVGDKKRIYKNVLDDMYRMVDEGEPGIDFLLTHYHADHFSGLMYLIRQRDRHDELQHIRFENVYIPNVWSIANSRDIVMALMMSYLPGYGKRRMNIFDFLIAICKTGGCIHLTNRGSIISNELIALWPPTDITSGIWLREIPGINEEFISTLGDIADELINIVLALIQNQRDGEHANAVLHLKMLRTRFYRLGKKAPDIDINTRIRLNEFGNEVSIVFHNIYSAQNGRNVLFTGDVHADAWDVMRSLQVLDGISLHDEYGIIKVPHHGTSGYFHDFGAYISQSQETKFLIPNGDIRRSGHGISSYYPNSCHGRLVCCSNNNSCEEKAVRGCCTCAPQIIVFPNACYHIM